MSCPKCKRTLATDYDYESMDEGEGQDLCWSMWGDMKCESIAQANRESALTTLEILQAAIDEGCEVGIYPTTPNNQTIINVEIEGQTTFGYSTESTLESAIAAAWQHYQTNKKQ